MPLSTYRLLCFDASSSQAWARFRSTTKAWPQPLPSSISAVPSSSDSAAAWEGEGRVMGRVKDAVLVPTFAPEAKESRKHTIHITFTSKYTNTIPPFLPQ